MKFSTELFPVLLVVTSILLSPSEAIGQKEGHHHHFSHCAIRKVPKHVFSSESVNLQTVRNRIIVINVDKFV